MLRIHFSSEDLGRITITAVADPLWETLLSLHLLQRGNGELVYGRWRRKARANLPVDAGLILELAPSTGYSPDFLTPPGGGADLDEALDAMLATPQRRIRTDLGYLAGRQATTPWSHRLAEADRETMHLLGDAVRSYHDNAIEPSWPSIRKLVAADRTMRGEQLVSSGVDGLLSDLHPSSRWDSPVLRIKDFAGDADVYLEGRGLTLIPSYFCWPAPTKLRDTDLPPVLVYPIAHRPGELEAAEGTAPSRTTALISLLGRTRATALDVLTTARTTTQLAAACRISIATASHHAAVLREASLISSSRIGGAVVHEVTELGAQLLSTSVETGPLTGT